MKSLNEITQWHPRSLQTWLREIEEIDLMLVMPHLPKAISHIIMENLSSRLRKTVNESYEEYKAVPEKVVARAKDRILELANELIEIGELNEPGEEDGNSYDMPRNTSLPNRLETGSTTNLVESLSILGKYAQERGILSLEEALGKINDPFLQEGLQLIIDGTDPDLVEEILRNRLEAITYHRELLYNLIIEGILSIQEGNSSWVLKTRLRSHLPPEMGGEQSLF